MSLRDLLVNLNPFNKPFNLIMEPRLAACEARRGGQLGELVLTAHAVQFEPATGASGGSSAVLLGDVTACAVDADGLLTLELADGAPQQAYAVAAAAIPRARRLVARLQQMLVRWVLGVGNACGAQVSSSHQYNNISRRPATYRSRRMYVTDCTTVATI